MSKDAASNFSQEEIDKYKNMGRYLTEKAIVAMLVSLIGNETSRAAKLCRKIERRAPRQCGHFSLEFDKDVLDAAEMPSDTRLVIMWAPCPRDHNMSVDIPESHANDLLVKFQLMKQIAAAYWRQYTEDNPAICAAVAKLRPDVDFTNLTVDPINPTTMYFDANSPIRIGICCMYMSDDAAYVKKHQ